jgi:hypothetical protein
MPRGFDYFQDQAAMLRRLAAQHLDPDRNGTAEELTRLERSEISMQAADDNEEQNYCDRWDGLS